MVRRQTFRKGYKYVVYVGFVRCHSMLLTSEI